MVKINKTTARPTLFLIVVDLAVVFIHTILPAGEILFSLGLLNEVKYAPHGSLC